MKLKYLLFVVFLSCMVLQSNGQDNDLNQQQVTLFGITNSDIQLINQKLNIDSCHDSIKNINDLLDCIQTGFKTKMEMELKRLKETQENEQRHLIINMEEHFNLIQNENNEIKKEKDEVNNLKEQI